MADWSTGRGSWYSQFNGANQWVDTQDRPNSNALGVPDDQQGIALPTRNTLGQWFEVSGPDGRVHRLQQTDIGPAKWTGRGIDISAAAADQMGYSPNNFPTNGGFSWRQSDDQTSPMQVSLQTTKTEKPMADKPSLGADFLTGGPGALFGHPDQNYNFGDALQNAGAWAMALDTNGKSLAGLRGTKDNFNTVTGPDGSIYMVDRRTGQLSQKIGPQPQPVDLGTNMFGENKKGFRYGNSIFDEQGRLVQQFGPNGAVTTGPGAAGDDIEALTRRLEEAQANGAGTDDLLKMMDEARAGLGKLIQARGEGRSVPSGMGQKGLSKNKQDYLTTLVYPDFDVQKVKNKQEALDSLTVPRANSYNIQRSGINTMLQQTARLSQAYDDLYSKGSAGAGWVNRFGNTLSHDLLGKSPELDTIRNTISELAPEATKVARGNAGAEADIKRAISNVDPSAPPPQFYNSMMELVRTLRDRAGESQASLDETFKPFPKERGQHQMIRPEGEQALQHFIERYNKSALGIGNGPKSRYVTPGMPDTKPPAAPNWNQYYQ